MIFLFLKKMVWDSIHTFAFLQSMFLMSVAAFSNAVPCKRWHWAELSEYEVSSSLSKFLTLTWTRSNSFNLIRSILGSGLWL